MRAWLLIAAVLWLWPEGAFAAAPAKAAKKPAPVPAVTEEEQIPYDTIVLQGLNKVTGHISTLDGPVGTVLRFGNLEIIAHRCWTSPSDETPENAAMLEISELKPGEAPQQIFLGWMFSSSPGLSGLEHPVYDITVVSCVPAASPDQDDADGPDIDD